MSSLSDVQSSFAAALEPQFDRVKWDALVKYDPQIGAVAERLGALGQKWVDECAAAYLAINDKSYLPGIVGKIAADARAEKALEEDRA